ncbi:alpha/beta hydrolase [Pseudomonas sp. GCM10022186]|uniref:alpha/beta hydrolase n=1 Tax=Pseudomonas sp. GCM10022186 TaxID=3252650 RepID=UPI003620BD7F
MSATYPLSPAMAGFVARSQAFTADGTGMVAARAAYDALCRAFTPPRAATVEWQALRLGRVPARLYRPAGPAPDGGWPAVLFIHGGGWMLGGLDSHAFLCDRLAARLPLAVVAVDYRLAPEHPFPTALEDCLEAWRALEPSRSGLDGSRLAVMGDSAGGNLAVALCLALREAGEALPCAQALIYPALSALPLPSHRALADAPLLSGEDLEACLAAYLPDLADRRRPLASPLEARDFRGMPEAFVAVAEFDPLHDDGAIYAQRLADDGVAVEYRMGTGLVHGCLRGIGQVPEVDQLHDRLCAWLSRTLRLPCGADHMPGIA